MPSTDEDRKERKRAARKARYEANKESELAVRKAWREANKERQRAAHKAWREANKEHAMWLAARLRSRKAGIPFNIELSDIVIPERCPVLDIPLVRGYGAHHAGSPSLDRIVPELGYVKGNVIVISYRANQIKSNATLPELEAVAAYVRRAIKSLH